MSYNNDMDKNHLVRTTMSFVMIVFLLGGCAKRKEPVVIDDINDLHGLRVGTMLAWECDYLLTPREDIKLYRYDQISDMLMALNYDKIDAIAVDLLYWNLIDNSSSGLKMIEPAFGSTGYLLYVRPEHRDFVDKYNEFLKGFKMTDTYKDLIERELAFNGNYKSPDIPLSGKGETIRVAFDITGYPRAFYDSETGEVSGFDFEVLKRFVNEYDYQLDFVMTDYNYAYAGLNSGIYDGMIGYLSDTYKEEVESVGLIVTDTYDNVPLVYVCKETTGNIDIDMNSLE